MRRAVASQVAATATATTCFLPIPSILTAAPAMSAKMEVDDDETALESRWLDSVEGEIAFFRSLMRARPVGIHRHFHVLTMRNAILRDTGELVAIDDLWAKLRTCYDLDILENIVSPPRASARAPSLFTSSGPPLLEPRSARAAGSGRVRFPGRGPRKHPTTTTALAIPV